MLKNKTIYYRSKTPLNTCLILLSLTALVSQGTAQTNTITYPANQSEFLESETFTITADVSDPDGLNVVRLWKKGGTDPGVVGLLNYPPYAWDVSIGEAGEYVFYTRSKDLLGNLMDSDAITVNIVNSYNRIITPNDGVAVDANSPVTITAEVADTDGIASVELWQNDGTTAQVVSALTSPPYEWTVSVLASGKYTYYTRSKDLLENKSDSDAITVNFFGDYNRIISPKDGASFTRVEPFSVTAEVADSDGINAVLLWMNDGNIDSVVSTLSTPPFVWEFNELGSGTYTFHTQLKDDLNNLTDSKPVTVKVEVEAGVFPEPGTTVALTASINRKYLSAANPDSTLIANRDIMSAYEQFEVIQVEEDYFAFRCLGNDKYLAVDPTTSHLKANSASIGNAEQFKFTERRNQLGLAAKVNDLWVTVDNNDGAKLIANSAGQGHWQSFTWTQVEVSEKVADE